MMPPLLLGYVGQINRHLMTPCHHCFGHFPEVFFGAGVERTLPALDAQRFGERRAAMTVDVAATLMARPFDLLLDGSFSSADLAPYKWYEHEPLKVPRNG